MRTCIECGTSIEGYRRQARYCGGPCRAAASRARKAEKAARAVEHQALDQTAPKRTHATTEVVAWDALARHEQHRIEGILERHADLLGETRPCPPRYLT
jgi:hypothetical protein